MKHIIIITFCLTLPIIGFTQKNALYLTPLQPITGKISVRYERQINRFGVGVEFQKWFEHRSSSSGLFFFPLAGSTETYENKGYRVTVFSRLYFKEPGFSGGFIEGGIFSGKHNVTIEKETSTFLPFTLNFLDWYQSTVTRETYNGLRYNGFRLGLGYRITRGCFIADFTGGITQTTTSAKFDAPLNMQQSSPYTRLAIGFQF